MVYRRACDNVACSRNFYIAWSCLLLGLTIFRNRVILDYRRFGMVEANLRGNVVVKVSALQLVDVGSTP